MRSQIWSELFAIFLYLCSTVHAAGIMAANVTVGPRLQVNGNVTLDSPAPAGGVTITLLSNDPNLVQLSLAPDEPGKQSITVQVRPGLRGSPDYYIHGLKSRGTATYTASAPGFERGTATVTLAPSGVIFARAGIGMQGLQTTSGAASTVFGVYTALLDESGGFVQVLPVAGGHSVKVEVASSHPDVGTLGPSIVTIPGGAAMSQVEFRPVGHGSTTLQVSIPAGFSPPLQYGAVPAMVITPGVAITDEIAIGKNLQVAGHVSLGQPAPPGGAEVVLRSGDPKKLILSDSPVETGSGLLKLAIPAGEITATYYLQALDGEGTVTYSAAVPGYRSRDAVVTLTPSGLVLGGPQGPPDEAELTREDIAKGPHGFVTSASGNAPTIVYVYTVQLDPVTRRGADLTVQQVRAGVSVKAILTNTNPAAGVLEAAELVIHNGKSIANTYFVPSAPGQTLVSVATPAGYTTAENSTALSIEVTR